MMRYQRVSPDCVPLSASNGKKQSNGGTLFQASPTPLSTTTMNNNANLTPSSSFEPNKGFRFRSPTNNNHLEEDNNGGFHNHDNHYDEATPPQHRPEESPSDKLLQWGQRRRSRASRTEIRALTDDSSSSSSAQAKQHSLKPQRRHVGPTAMPPPLPPPSSANPSSSSNGRARKESSASLFNRNLEDRSGSMNGSPSKINGGNSRIASRSPATGKRSPPSEKSEKKTPSSARSVNEKLNGLSLQADSLNHHNNNNIGFAPKEEKPSAEVAFEWPRIQIPLSRKEKEDDFLILKGSKLPQRPKKRPKNVERALQFCFPGTWLSEVSKSRYEVKEKKCAKKQQQKRRGLKGMESLDSDSE